MPLAALFCNPHLNHPRLQETVPHIRRIPFHELCPWWWSRDRGLRPLATVPHGLGGFRNCPDTIDLLSRPVLMGRFLAGLCATS